MFVAWFFTKQHLPADNWQNDLARFLVGVLKDKYKYWYQADISPVTLHSI